MANPVRKSRSWMETITDFIPRWPKKSLDKTEQNTVEINKIPDRHPKVNHSAPAILDYEDHIGINHFAESYLTVDRADISENKNCRGDYIHGIKYQSTPNNHPGILNSPTQNKPNMFQNKVQSPRRSNGFNPLQNEF